MERLTQESGENTIEKCMDIIDKIQSTDLTLNVQKRNRLFLTINCI